METIVTGLIAGFTQMVTDLTDAMGKAAPVLVPLLGITVGTFVIVRFAKKFLGR